MAKNKLKTHLILDQLYLSRLIKKALGLKKLAKISVYPVKVKLTSKFEHVVLAVKAKPVSGKSVGLYAMGHSSGIKKKLYQILCFFRDKEKQVKIRVPEPLLYDKKTKSIIYKELAGPNLYELLEKKKKNLLPIFRSLGRSMARIHRLPKNKIFQQRDVTMAELDPSDIVADIRRSDKQLYQRIDRAEKKLGRMRSRLFKQSRKRRLVHGDLHPENVIVMNKNYSRPKLGLIDIENAALSDREQDIGSFIEQVEIMAVPYFTKEKIKKFQEEFIRAYSGEAKIEVAQIKSKLLTFYRAFYGLKAVIFYYRLGWFGRQKIILNRVEKYLEKISI